jgi:amino acid adenylation domain-containing protein
MDEPIPAPESRGPTRRQLLFQRLKETKEARLGATGGIPRLGQTSAELSYAQQRLWILEQIDPGNPRFCILTGVRLRGEAREDALAAALREMVRRHEILRTAFVAEDGRPRQVIAPRMDLELPRVDLSGLPEPVREPLLARLLTAEAQRPFDLARLPLVRTFLVRLGPAERVLVLTQHQSIVDRWSRGLFVRELTALYAAFAAGRPSPLPPPELQYADFSQWQRERLQGEALDTLLGYWRAQLEGSPPLDLPADRPRPPVQRSRGTMRYSVIPKPLLGRLQAFSQAMEGTLFMTLLAAFAALLYRYSGQEDVVVGSPIANRNQKQVESLMGFFVNMLALRTRVSGELTFRELAERTKTVALGAFAHQDLPFELLVRELQAPRDLSRHPLFQVSLVVQNTPMPPVELPGLAVSLVEVDWGTTAYDLALFFWETGLFENLEEGLSLITAYSTDLYDGPTIARLVLHLGRLLAAAMDEPDRPLRELDLLSEAERHQLLREWRGVEGRLLPWQPLHELVEARRPDAPAADFGDGPVSYAELCGRARRLAARLASLGVAPESPVALVLPPSLDLVVACLATSMAGGACLPVDPELPAERIRWLLADSGAAVVVTQSTLEAGDVGEAPQRRVDPDNLACILYTSGSTGTPKAVGISHRAVACMAGGKGPAALAPEDRVVHAASPSFDAALWEIWAPLLSGACIVGLERDALLSPQRLGRALAERRASALFVPTALLHTLAGEEPACFGGLRLLLFGGEVADPAAVRAVLRHRSSVVHLYGPTEATTYATLQRVAEVPPRASSVPVGRPAPGRRIALLDADLSPVPVGVEGEVWIGGEGLARGYLRAPDLTAASFVPDPFSDEPGARAYRTGDRARWLPDGTLEIHGRLDEQIKVRGFRIEPAEVRAALTAHPAVREAAVTVRHGRLEAWAVARSGEDSDEAELLAFLRQRLPAWMVPSRLTLLPALPRTAAGKVDLQALPEAREARTAGEPPQSPAERKLADIWREVLGRDVPGLQDDFFELGGNSLDAARTIARAARAFGVDLSVRALYEAPTLAAFVERMEKAT